ncbi:hypothetical protein AWW66_11555 [Micromonospora rosaria]|uniref:Uncharacterized protein n=1 Tax=Micromonospora rosaria TaxID=47874 RepID=A0A136PU05_9ACTN|nr:hypothetical protein [Micromonospora rosaria]KXK61814.1 hypothetical protein AWW66_11555 [Micromonospora rosaria]
MARGWGGSIATATGVAAGAGAAQLGFGYGLGIITWAPAGTAPEEAAWVASLAWATWIAATSTVVGAIGAQRLRERPAGPATDRPEPATDPTPPPDADRTSPTATGRAVPAGDGQAVSPAAPAGDGQAMPAGGDGSPVGAAGSGTAPATGTAHTADPAAEAAVTAPAAEQAGTDPAGRDTPPGVGGPGRDTPPGPGEPGRDPARGGTLGRLMLAVAAAIGALTTVLLVAVPARVAELPGTTAPQAVAAGYAGAGVLLGFLVALWALHSPAARANLVATVAWLWLLAVAAVVDGVLAGRGLSTAQLGIWQLSADNAGFWLRDYFYWPGAALALGSALVIGVFAARRCARNPLRRVGAAVSGAAGPLLVAVAYFLVVPRLGTLGAEQVSAHLVAPYAVIVGAGASALVAALGQRSATRAAERRARAQRTGAAHPSPAAFAPDPLPAAAPSAASVPRLTAGPTNPPRPDTAPTAPAPDESAPAPHGTALEGPTPTGPADPVGPAEPVSPIARPATRSAAPRPRTRTASTPGRTASDPESAGRATKAGDASAAGSGGQPDAAPPDGSAVTPESAAEEPTGPADAAVPRPRTPRAGRRTR